jgi:hypothetical protein
MRTSPWMTLDIKQLSTRARKLWRAGKSAEYKITSEKLEREIFLRKRSYNKRTFSAAKPNYWRFVNDYIELKQSADEDMTLANELNDGFYSNWGGCKQPDLSSFTTTTDRPPMNKPVFTAGNVVASMSELNTSSPGPDGISAALLKSARLELCDTVADIFNGYIDTGFVPSQWLAASITPIAKVEHPSSWSDYRPISLTSHLCKVFEKIIVKFILSITWRIWKSNKQYGFLPGRSTVDAAVHVFYDISKAFDQAIPSLAIFFDFAKAFDLVPHDKLLAKLLGYCQLPAWLVRWIANYPDRPRAVRAHRHSIHRVEARRGRRDSR